MAQSLFFSLFGPDNKLKEKKVIEEDTILVLDPDTGDVVESFGKGMFYVPHGITVDNQGNIYVTDVGLHQVKRVSQASQHKVLQFDLTCFLTAFNML